MAAVVQLTVGSTFSSFESLEAEIKAYQSKKFVQLVKRDTRTLEMAGKRVPKRVPNPALVYYSIHCACAFGGKSYKNGQRRNQRLVFLIKKSPVTGLQLHSMALESIVNCMKPYATTYVHKQLELYTRVNIVKDNGVQCEVASSNGQLNVTIDSCQCTFWNSMHLPCRHMFAVRKHRQVSLFSSCGVDARWTRAYMQDKYSRKKEGVPCTSSSGVCLPLHV